MDRQLSPTVLKKRKQSLLLKVGGVIAAILLLAFAFRSFLQPVVHLSDIKISKCDVGNIEASVSASGVIVPEFEEVVTSPITSRITHVYKNTGETVNNGDIILSLDNTNEQLQLDKMADELASKQNRIKKMQLTIERTLIDLQTNYEIQKLRAQSMETALKNETYMKSLGASSLESVKQAEMNSKIADMESTHMMKSLENQKTSMQTDLQDLEYEISIHRRNMDEIRKHISNAEVKASGHGVITWINDKIGTTVSAGSELVKMANLTSFTAEGTVTDLYSRKLAIGGKVNILFNDSILTGKIAAVNPTVQNDAVKFKVQLDKKNHPSLRSNQKVDIYIVTSFREKVLRLPRGEFFSGISNPYVFVLKGDKAVRRTVKFGESNVDFVEIESGLEAGEEIIASNMQEKMNLKKIKVKE